MQREAKAVDIGFHQLFHDDHFVAIITAASAIFFGDGAIQEAHLARHIPIFAIDFFILAKLFGMRRHFARIEPVNGLAEDVDVFFVVPVRIFKIDCGFSH